MNPDIITKALIKRKLSIDDLKPHAKEVLTRALLRCSSIEIEFVMTTYYNKIHDLYFSPNEIGRLGLDFVMEESSDNFYDMPYEFIFSYVNFSKRTLGGYCYRNLDRILNDELYNELNSEYLKFQEEYKYNVIKSLFLSGRYFKYKDFPLKYNYTDGDIFEHPINENDVVTANFAKVVSFDDEGFYYKKGEDLMKTDYITFGDLDFLFDHKIKIGDKELELWNPKANTTK